MLIGIDVVMVVKNGNTHLNECLTSLYANVPVNKLIVVDGGSGDGTLHTVKRFPRVLIIDDSSGTRATARQKGIEIVETDWFMFLDSDVVLSHHWFTKISRYMAIPSIGAVQGVDRPLHDDVRTLNRLISGIWKNEPFWLGLPIVDGIFTGDTLIRRDAVAGIKIPPYLHVYEDRYIRRYIEERGYKWVIARDVNCIHYTCRKSIDAYYLGLLDAYAGYDNKRSFAYFLKNLAACGFGVLTGPKVAAKCFKLLLWNFAGSLKVLSAKPTINKNLLADIARY